MAGLLHDFGESDLVSRYEMQLTSAFGGLEQRVEKLPIKKQSQILSELTEQFLKAIYAAQRGADREISHLRE